MQAVSICLDTSKEISTTCLRFSLILYIYMYLFRMDISWFNLQNVFRSLFPSSEEAIDELYRLGVQRRNAIPT